MKDKITSITNEAKSAIQEVSELQALNDLRVKYLGKKGELTLVLRGMGEVSPEERPVIGSLINEAKEIIKYIIK